MIASNPMQRKSRNSFLLGIIVTLLITGVIIAALLLLLKQKNDELQAELNSKARVYTLKQDVKAGQILTEDMFVLKAINKDTIPNNATSMEQVIKSWFLQTKSGERVCTDEYGLYLDRKSSDLAADTIIEVQKTINKDIKDDKGNIIVAAGEYFIEVNGKIEKVNSIENYIQDEYGVYFVDTQGNDTKTRVYKEEGTEEFYIYKIDTTTMNTTGSKVRVKEYIEIKNVPVLARVDMDANTVITPKLVVQSDEIITDDVRQEQYNMITLPIDLMTNDYVDIRLKAPNGQNFIVVAKALVDIPMNEDGSYVSDTIRVNLREDEILAMSSAIVEAYGLSGSELYVTKYVDPAMQDAALPTYTPNAAVTAQIDANGDGKIDNPNIVEEAKRELASRYSEAAKSARNDYLQQVINNTSSEEYLERVEEKVQQNIGTSITSRKQYLDSLGYSDSSEEEDE